MEILLRNRKSTTLMQSGISTEGSRLQTSNFCGALTLSSGYIQRGVCWAHRVVKCVQVSWFHSVKEECSPEVKHQQSSVMWLEAHQRKKKKRRLISCQCQKWFRRGVGGGEKLSQDAKKTPHLVSTFSKLLTHAGLVPLSKVLRAC